jgi:phosphohistidine phosphatase SixA
VAVFLVRHAKAGSRSDWTGDDIIRPLSKKGWAQARALAQLLLTHSPKALLSSPYVRCRQTLEPLAELTSLPLTEHSALTEGASFVDTLSLLHEVEDGAVLCSHGDVIPATIDALIRRGLELKDEPDLRKAATFVLHRENGVFTTAQCWSPPGI